MRAGELLVLANSLHLCGESIENERVHADASGARHRLGRLRQLFRHADRRGLALHDVTLSSGLGTWSPTLQVGVR